MRNKEKLFRFYFLLVCMLIIVSFIIVFIWQFDQNNILETFLVSASTAGFFGLLGQMILMLVQEYHQRKTYTVVFLYRESQFSEALCLGVKNHFSQIPDIRLQIHKIPHSESSEEEMISFLEKNASPYDGFIIRPIDTNTELFTVLDRLLKAKKEVVLVDLSFTDLENAKFPGENPPFYIGSDFSYGGRLASNEIEELMMEFGEEDTELIIVIGPDNLASAQKRGKSLVWELSKNGMNEKTRYISIDTFNLTSVMAEVDITLNEIVKSNTYKDKNIIIFCGNDSIALEMIKQQNTDPNSGMFKLSQQVKELYYLGYDGVKDDENDYKLQRYPVNFSTIDVLPQLQGEKAAEAMADSLQGKQNMLRLKELVKPKIYKHRIEEK